jgi:hypothetical protein
MRPVHCSAVFLRRALSAAATWDRDQGVRLLVDREQLGGAAEVYLYGRAASA